MKKQYGVYTHARPNGIVFYVGKGTVERSKWINRGTRYQWHQNIVNKYGSTNIRIRFFKCPSEKIALLREARMITNYRKRGLSLVNFNNGGEGCSGYRWTLQQKEKLRKTKARPEKRTKLRKSIKRFWKNNPEARIRVAKKIRNIWKDPKYRKQFSKKIKENWKNPKRRPKLLAGVRRTNNSPKVRKLRSQQFKRLWKTKKFRNKVIKSHLGHVHTKEHKKKISDSCKKYWKTKRVQK